MCEYGEVADCLYIVCCTTQCPLVTDAWPHIGQAEDVSPELPHREVHNPVSQQHGGWGPSQAARELHVPAAPHVTAPTAPRPRASMLRPGSSATGFGGGMCICVLSALAGHRKPESATLCLPHADSHWTDMLPASPTYSYASTYASNVSSHRAGPAHSMHTDPHDFEAAWLSQRRVADRRRHGL